MKNKTVRIVIWIIFILCCLASGAYFSMTPYWWGERDGSGILLWFCTVIPFLILQFSVMIFAMIADMEGSIPFKSYAIVFAGSLGVFLLNWLFQYLLTEFDYFSELRTPAWMWIGYVSLPFIYGGVSYFLFKNRMTLS